MTPSHAGREFGLGRALLFSLLLHALMLWLGARAVTWWVEASPARPAEVLRFQFAQPAPTRERVEPPPGVVPHAPRRPVAPEPQPLSPAPPMAPAMPEPAAPASEPAPLAESTAEASARELEAPATPDATRSPAAPRAEAGAAEERQARRFDLQQALERFRRAPASPPSDRDSPRPSFVPPQFPPSGFGVGNLVFESADYDWTDYARQIYIEIWKAWHNRLYRTTDAFERWAYGAGSWWLEHASGVAFTIERSGEVTGIVIETPSGCLPLDDSAADALREVILPPLPRDFPRARERVHARFIAEGDVRNMRRYLTMLKEAGYF